MPSLKGRKEDALVAIESEGLVLEYPIAARKKGVAIESSVNESAAHECTD
jgi:hypothetical protein